MQSWSAARRLRRAWIWAAMACVAVPSALARAADDAERPPNIVLIMADDLGIADLRCYGRAEHATDQLDGLAAAGVRFVDAYAPHSVCSPTRAALLTGKCPARLHLTNFLPGRPDCAAQRLRQPRIEGQLPLEETTLAETLRQAGYATGMFGKWHLGGDGFGPGQQGFDEYETPGPSNDGASAAGGKAEYAITAAAEAFFERHRERPFFCYVAHHSPHIPLAAAPDRVAEHAAAFQPVYAAMIETLDDAVGRILAKLDALGLAERTLVIFTSDNGGLHVLEYPSTPATHCKPYRAGKGFLYEGGLRVPLIVRWPGVAPAGLVCDQPVVLTDLVPTLLAAAGVNVATTVGPLDGVDVTPLLRGETLEPRDLAWHMPNYTNQGGRPAGALRSGPWKLVEQYEDGRLELYHLGQDPGETRDLAAQHPALVRQLQQRLAEWRLRVGAQLPQPNPEFDPQAHARLYRLQDPSRLFARETAVATEPAWRDWRRAMDAARRGARPEVTPATGDVRLQARDARVHAQTMRYEPEPHKNVLGYWTRAEDWADWEFAVATGGRYEVEVQQGCGAGSGGAEVRVEVAGQRLTWTVQETGHFQHMIQLTLGEVQLEPGTHTLAVRPQTKPGVAVMDLRRIVLRPLN